MVPLGVTLHFALSGFGFVCFVGIWPLLLDMRRRFKAVMNVLDAIIRHGASLSRSFDLTAQWDEILTVGPLVEGSGYR